MAIPESTDEGWIIDADQKRKDVKAFNAVLAAATSDDDAIPFFQKAVKRWPYPYDPAQADSYEELTTTELAEVMFRVQAAFQQIYDRILKRGGVSNDVARRADAK